MDSTEQADNLIKVNKRIFDECRNCFCPRYGHKDFVLKKKDVYMVAACKHFEPLDNLEYLEQLYDQKKHRQ